MKKRVISSLIILVIVFYSTNFLLAEDFTDGAWKLEKTGDLDLRGDLDLDELIYFKRSGSALELWNVLTNKKVAEGKIYQHKKSQPQLAFGSDNFKMEGIVWGNGNEMSGIITGKDPTINIYWRAIKVLGVFVCGGNHNPKHVATSIEEIQKLTKKNGCTNWSLTN